ncbi:SDR family NAD(P)-dependent oxidoreductase [Roseateles chitosanitabidus]|jgi:NAD(P)-dependent dehydrogenase (short-subunit alcohol dehydrogenase family)|uniref:SDR family NAD(P)-dependent oxidoreductase n=1 Tax=Roseateles chitosanitabidus TaxID=65048 RepID=UPI0008306702|nr:SDR family oxidoreductase [Roseateles chitosanitabidus]MBO9687152.1 SDR family oxidoreductase [Roseateles chitosanitabidus]
MSTSASQPRRVALVTGASQGIGAGLVAAYRALGYAVVANSRNIRQGDDTDIVAVPGHIGERAVAERIVQTALDRFGRIDTLINNAGIFVAKPFSEYTVQDFRDVIDVNLGGFFHVTQLAIPQMLRQRAGHIVQITTTLVEQPIAGVPAGLASLTKGGLDAVTRGLAIEYAKDGIRVNAVSPGVIRTPMHAPETHAFLAGLHPMGRMGEIDEIVDAVRYLEQAAFVTGETLHVDGGQHAGR